MGGHGLPEGLRVYRGGIPDYPGHPKYLSRGARVLRLESTIVIGKWQPGGEWHHMGLQRLYRGCEYPDRPGHSVCLRRKRPFQRAVEQQAERGTRRYGIFCQVQPAYHSKWQSLRGELLWTVDGVRAESPRGQWHPVRSGRHRNPSVLNEDGVSDLFHLPDRGQFKHRGGRLE